MHKQEAIRNKQLTQPETEHSQAEQDWYEFPKDLIEGGFGCDESAREKFYQAVLGLVVVLTKIIARKKGIRLPEDIDDIVQDVMVTIIVMGTKRLKKVRHWPSFLYTLVHRRCVDLIRKRAKRDGTVSLDEELNSDDGACKLADFIGAQPTQESDAVTQEFRNLFEAFLKTTAKEKQQVLRLYVQGYTGKEIAEKTGIPVSTIHVWIFRAKMQFIEWMQIKHIAWE